MVGKKQHYLPAGIDEGDYPSGYFLFVGMTSFVSSLLRVLF